MAPLRSLRKTAFSVLDRSLPRTSPIDALFLSARFYRSHNRMPRQPDRADATFNDLIFSRLAHADWSEFERFCVDKENVKLLARLLCPGVRTPSNVGIVRLAKLSGGHLVEKIGSYSGRAVVAKPTHGSGDILFLSQRPSEEEVRRFCRNAEQCYYHRSRESLYKGLDRKVVIEEDLSFRERALSDYKFFCARGDVLFCQVDVARFTRHRRALVTDAFELIDVRYKHDFPTEPLVKPANFNEMLDIARRISGLFQFVRIDLYSVQGTVFLGELTFAPEGGTGSLSSEDFGARVMARVRRANRTRRWPPVPVTELQNRVLSSLHRDQQSPADHCSRPGQPAAGASRRRLLVGGLTVLATGLLQLSGAFAGASGRSFYVAPSGNDAGPGTVSEPFKTISRVFAAVPDLGANDCIVVMPGDYAEQVVVTRGGDDSGYLTVRSQVLHAARIRAPKGTYSAVNIVSSYVAFEGFDVRGDGTGHGIEATFLDGNPANNGPHHVRIMNNIAHDNAGSGISVSYGDFYTIEGNICYRNCATNEYQGSGISIYAARAISDEPASFRNVVRRNICFENIALDLPGEPEPPHSDGNGIIIDDLKNSQSGHPAGNYPHKTLVDSNLTYRNGGRGVHVYYSDNVVVLNNTSYHNNRDPLNPATWRGELSSVASSNIVWANNIGVADPVINPNNTAILEASRPQFPSSNVVWRNNLTFDGEEGRESLNFQRPASLRTVRATGSNLLGVAPLFVASAAITKSSDFHLRSGSPAIDAGTLSYGASSLDLGGNPRVIGGAIDLGAFECQRAEDKL